MRRSTTWRWLVIALLMLLAPEVAGAQEPGVTLEARALYDGTSKYGEWLPVVVELENNGADVQGRVAVEVSGSGGEATYAQLLELPRGARKQVTVYVIPNNFSRRLTATFVPEGAREPLAAQEVEVRPVPNIRFIVAGVTDGGAGLEALAGVNFRGERQSDRSSYVPLTLDTLPERPEALRTLDMIVLTGVDSRSLTPRQQAALEQYVATGGLLVLGGGPEAERVLAGIPESLRPITLGGERALETVDSLMNLTGEPVRVNGPFPAALAAPLANAVVVAQEGELPMIVERPVGRGTVFWLALDPSLSPFDAWAGVEPFWRNLVGTRAHYPPDLPPDLAPRQMANNDLFYALQNLPSLDLPSLQLLVPLLALYILVVGPVNYFVLRRQRRLELAWLTIPLVTLLFSVGAYGLGFRLRGSDVIVNQVSLVQGVPGGESAYVRSLIGVFSPSRRRYDLTVRGEPLLSPTQVNYDPFSGTGSNSSGGATLVQGQPALVEGLTVNQWSMQSVLAESLVTEGFGFEAELQTADGKLVGTLTNRSAYPWEDVVVVLGQQFARVGDVAAGASKQIELNANQGMDQQGGFDLAWRIFQDDFNSPTGPPREVQVRQQMLNTLFNGPFTLDKRTSLAGSRAPVLLAWIADSPTKVNVTSRVDPTSVATTLFYSELPLSFGTGHISLPRGMLEARLVVNDGGSCYGPAIVSVAPDFSTAEVQFTLPPSVRGIDPSLLSLYVTSDGGMFAAPRLSLYDYQTESWVELDEPMLGRNGVSDPDAFVSSEGIVWLRVENEARNQGGCLFFEAGLDGELATADAEARLR